jgi:hypothetical protein
MSFDEWWKSYWDPLSGPEVTNLMFKEVAQNSWYAAQDELLSTYPKSPLHAIEKELRSVQVRVDNLGESS